MTTRCPPHAPTLAERLPTLDADATRVLRLLSALAGPSCRCEVDLYALAPLLGLRPISFRLALLALKLSGRVGVRRRRGRARLVVTLFLRGVTR